MGATTALLGLYACAVAAVALVARGLARPLPAWVLAAAALLPVLLFPGSFFSDRTALPLDHARAIAPWRTVATPAPTNPDLNDVALQILPWAKASRVALKAGELPWRNRWNGGAPLAANALSGALSPFTLIGLVLPLARAFTLMAAVKILLAAAGTWLLAREIAISPASALFAAVAVALSFGMTAWLFCPQASVSCLIPWMLFLIERSRDTNRLARRRALAALTLVFAGAFLSGHPETLVLGLVFAALWILGRRVAGSLPDGLPLFARTAAAGALAAALTAWLLLPELAAIRASGRLASLEDAPLKSRLPPGPHGPISAAGLVTSVFPHAFGSSVGSPSIPGAPAAFPELAYGYAGILPVLFALLILRPGSRRRREAIVLLALILLALGLAVGQWPFLEIVARVPGLEDVSPLRFLAWLALAVPLLAALELDRLEKDAASAHPLARFAPLAAAVLLFAAAAGVAHRLAPLHRAAGGLDFQRRELAAAGLLLGLGAAAAFLLARLPEAKAGTLATSPKAGTLATSPKAGTLATSPKAGTLAALCAVLTAAELLRGGRRLYGSWPTEWMYPPTPLLEFVRSRPGTFRVAGEGGVLYPGSAAFAGLEDIRTHDAAERRDYVAFLDATCGFPPLDYFKTLRRLDAPALDFLNVRYLLTAPDRAAPGPKWRRVYADAQGAVFENDGVLPRVFAPAAIAFVPAPRDAAGDRDALARIAATPDWRAVAYVASAPGTGRRDNPRVEVLDYAEDTDDAAFRTRASSPAWVVASLTQDGGWTARDEAGRSLPVAPANGPFLAVAVPAGDHAIRLRYRPPGFAAGLGIALVSLLAFAGVGTVAARERPGEVGGRRPPPA